MEIVKASTKEIANSDDNNVSTSTRIVEESTTLTEVCLTESVETIIGTRSIYHGEVDIHNSIEIAANKPFSRQIVLEKSNSETRNISGSNILPQIMAGTSATSTSFMDTQPLTSIARSVILGNNETSSDDKSSGPVSAVKGFTQLIKNETSSVLLGNNETSSDDKSSGPVSALKGFTQLIKNETSNFLLGNGEPSEGRKFEELSPVNERTPLIRNGSTTGETVVATKKAKFSPLKKVLCCLALGLVCASLGYGYFHYMNNKDYDDNDLPVQFLHRYRHRDYWGALPPKHKIPLLKYIPPKYVVISHTASKPCNTSILCSTALRNIQAGQFTNQLDDIAYNFMVGGDGLIYEGRGWKASSASTHGMGCSSWAVAFVGDFQTVQPPPIQIDAFRLLMETALAAGRINDHYKMFMQSEIIATKSPGQELVKILQEWDHWQPFSSSDLLCN